VLGFTRVEKPGAFQARWVGCVQLVQPRRVEVHVLVVDGVEQPLVEHLGVGGTRCGCESKGLKPGFSLDRFKG
jgi:hypothetical protein